jgi:hypothetical protein
MSLKGRISELSTKHRQLDQKISETQKHPSVDPLELKDLKRQKLKLKEQLQWLKAS